MRSDILRHEYDDYDLHVILCSLADGQYQLLEGTPGVETTGFHKILIPVYQTKHYTPDSCNLNNDLLFHHQMAYTECFKINYTV
jgi:hypothetical protein